MGPWSHPAVPAAATRDRRAPSAYTRKVPSLSERLTSVAVVFALAGSPLVRPACTAVCLHGGETGTAVPEVVVSAEHAGHAPVAAPVATSIHTHHGSSAPDASAEAATSSPSWPGSSNVRLRAACTDCGADWQLAFVSGPVVERTDARSHGASPPPLRVAPFPPGASALRASPSGPPVPPPSAHRAPLVLRV